MRIALDYCDGADPKRAGKGEYVYQLTREMVAQRPDIQFSLLIAKDQRVDIERGNVTVIKIPVRRGPLWHVFALFWLTFSQSTDLYFSTTSAIIPALLLGKKVVTTVFDFTSWRFAATHDSHAQKIEKLFMRTALLRSAGLIAISEFTKRETIELFRVPDQKITVAPLAVDPLFFEAGKLSKSQLQAVSKKYNLPQSFILCLATIEPRKNMTAVIEAYQKLRSTHPDLHLVLAGNPGWYSDEILAGAGSGVTVTGYIDAEDRPALYRLASVFVFPSLYEGFGMPPLESITAGTPTIVSNRASLPEVVGPAGQVVSLERPDNLRQTILETINWSDSQKKAWRTIAATWADGFSWERTARQTLDLLLSI